MPNHYVIVGGGLAADAAAKAISAQDAGADVTVITSEAEGPYRRPHLSKALWSDGTIEKAMLGTADGTNANVITGRSALGLNTHARTVTLDDEQVLEYDQLLIATG